MKCKVYRALDRPQVFFGIKGRFITWYLIAALQDKSSDREFSIRMEARKYPRFYRLRPQPFRELLNDKI